MALIENVSSGIALHGAAAGVWQGLMRRRAQRHLRVELSGKAVRILCDMGMDPAAITARPWTYDLVDTHVIGNRP